MLDVRGNCSILRRSCVTLCMAWVHAGPAQVLCGFKRQCILFAWRQGHERRGNDRDARRPLLGAHIWTWEPAEPVFSMSRASCRCMCVCPV